MDVAALESILREGDVSTVVVTLGTTATGAVDPLHKVLALRSAYPFRVHLDAAYGGYFTLVSTLGEEAARAFACVAQADSIVVDPHKHGLQPYGCGCILFRDPAVGRFYKHDSPYTYFTSDELHLGEISLECSRAGAAAVALWATQRLLPLISDGEFAKGLRSSREAAMLLHKKICADGRFLSPFPPELDILVWAVRAGTVAASSRLAQEIFTAAARVDLHLALAQLPSRFFPSGSWPEQDQQSSVTCLRSVLMKPEHLDWLDAIWGRLSQVTGEVLAMPSTGHAGVTVA
jgi:glutamate/tyrosine decarboxylase-like PLP-dependent enzyme